MMERFPPEPLRQYAVLADGERGAVIGPRGDIAFLCVPRWQDDAVFASLVGGGGHYAVTPSEQRYVWGGHYEPGTLIWRSRWVTSEGVIECREALLHPGPGDRVVVLRRVEALDAEACVDVVLDPRPGFGRESVTWRRAEDGSWTGTGGGLHLRWSNPPPQAHVRDGVLQGQIRLGPGGRHDLVLEISPQSFAVPAISPGRAWRVTEESWRARATDLADNLAPTDVTHSLAVLHGLTSRSGGMVAAATMSLPERSDKGRNYDYRYAWIRDQCYAGHAAVAAGDLLLAVNAGQFVAERLLEHGPDLRPAYDVEGGAIPQERSLQLPGYPGGTDIVGNRVSSQYQLDVFGEALLLFAGLAEADLLEVDQAKAAEVAVAAIHQRWQRPDAGIWELEDRHWAHSRLMCAAGLRAYAHSGPVQHEPRLVEFAETLVRDVDRDCLHASGRWQRAPDDPRVDAALLLPAVRGAVAADDPRAVKTWEAVVDELSRDGYVYRFRHGPGPLYEAEGAFMLCGLHLAMATAQQGQQVDAVRRFERNRSAVGPPGLFAEEFDVVQRQLRGNLPQAFVHAMLVESAVRLQGGVEKERRVS